MSQKDQFKPFFRGAISSAILGDTFGSRVDLFLPLNSQLLIKEGDRVIGGISEIAKLGKF